MNPQETPGRLDPGSNNPPPWHRAAAVERYLERLAEDLVEWRTPEAEIDAILLDIESHIAEAQHGGRELPAILTGLGSTRELAESYGIALLLDERLPSRTSWWSRLVRRLVLASRGITSAMVLGLLAVLALGLGVAGAFGTLAAVVLPLLPPRVLDPTLRFGLPQLVVLALSLALWAISTQLYRWLRVHWSLWRHGSVGRRGRRTAVGPTETRQHDADTPDSRLRLVHRTQQDTHLEDRT